MPRGCRFLPVSGESPDQAEASRRREEAVSGAGYSDPSSAVEQRRPEEQGRGIGSVWGELRDWVFVDVGHNVLQWRGFCGHRGGPHARLLLLQESRRRRCACC